MCDITCCFGKTFRNWGCIMVDFYKTLFILYVFIFPIYSKFKKIEIFFPLGLDLNLLAIQ